MPKIWSIRFKERLSSKNPAAFSFPFSHLRLSRHSLWANEWQHCSRSSFVLFLGVSGKGDEWAWRRIYRKTKAGMKSKRQKQEQHLCDGGGGLQATYSASYLSVKYYTPDLCQSLCSQYLWHVQPLWGGKQAHNAVPSQPLQLIVSQGDPAIPKASMTKHRNSPQPSGISAPLMGAEILDTSDNTIFLFTPL